MKKGVFLSTTNHPFVMLSTFNLTRKRRLRGEGGMTAVTALCEFFLDSYIILHHVLAEELETATRLSARSPLMKEKKNEPLILRP